MWAEQVLLGVIGFASGAVIAGGLFSFLIGLGLVSSLRTGPTREDRFYCMKILLYWEGPSLISFISTRSGFREAAYFWQCLASFRGYL